MMETVLLLLLLGTWGGIVWVYRRLSHDLDDVARDRVEQSEMQGNLTRMVGQLQEAADELAQAMSARTGRLQDLLAQADERIAALDAAVARLREVADAASAAAASAPPGQVEVGAPRPPQFGQMADAKTHGYGNNGAGVRYADAAAASVAPPEQSPRGGENGFSAFEDVRRLAAAGLSAAEIAQRTHRGREEVRLLLQLAQAAEPNEGTNP